MTDSREFEASFSQILQRTRQNIDRVNSSLSSGGGGQASSFSFSSRYENPSSSSLYSSSRVESRFNKYEPNYSEAKPSMMYSSVPSSLGNSETVKRSPSIPPTPLSTSVSDSGSVTITAKAWGDILERIAALESKPSRDDSGRINALEKNQDYLQKQVESLGVDTREATRVTSYQSNQIRSQSQAIETLQSDLDAKRGVVSKLETWFREMETWRNVMESQVHQLSKSSRILENDIKAISASSRGPSSALNWPGQPDPYMDRIDVLMQQKIVAASATLQDKLESQIRILEKEITSGNSKGSNGASSEASIASTFPMEVMVRGLIGKEIRSVEDTLEQKVDYYC